MRLTALVIGACVVTPALAAQEIRGTVVDRASALPIAGAVVQLLDAGGTARERRITAANGVFRLQGHPAAVRLQVLRIGFRPYAADLASLGDGPVRVTMQQLPTMLEVVEVADESRCPRRADRPAALGLWEQARTGLLATVVARETSPAEMKVIAFDRYLAPNGNDIARQQVHLDSGSMAKAFAAFRSGTDFARTGFASDSLGGRWMHGPDAEVLLSEAFANAYCFHIADPQPERRSQVGLVFRPRERTDGRVDIVGTLWIDTLARALNDVEFLYVGMDRSTDPYRPGGHIWFRAMDNGVVLIDRWHLRLLTARADTTRDHRNQDVIRVWYDVTEGGGELARATWPGGHTWRADLGSLRGRTLGTGGRPMAGVFVRLDSTDYTAVSDAGGVFSIEDLLPGPYQASVVHPDLLPLRMMIPTTLRFTASRGSMQLANLGVLTPEEFVRARCRANSEQTKPPEGTAWLLARVMDPQYRPLRGVGWSIIRAGDTDVVEAKGGVTGSDGMIEWCRLEQGTQVEVRLESAGRQRSVTVELRDKVTILPILLFER